MWHCLFMFALTSIAQNLESNWQLHTEKNGVMFYSKSIESAKPNVQYLGVKIKNINSYAVTISWTYHLWFNGNCRNCNINDESGFYKKIVQVPANSDITLDYSVPDEKGLKIYSRFENTYLSNFEFGNLTIIK